MVKNLPAMQETQIQSLGQEDPLEKEMATHSSVLGDSHRGAWWATIYGVAESNTTEWLMHFNILTSGLCWKQYKNPRDRAEGEFLELAIGCPGEKPGFCPR